VHSWWYGIAGFGMMAAASHAPTIARAMLLLWCTIRNGIRSLVSPNLLIGLALLHFILGRGLHWMTAGTLMAGRTAGNLAPLGRSRGIASRICASMGLGAEKQLRPAASIPATLSRRGSLVVCSSCGLPFRWFPGRACTVCGSRQAAAPTSAAEQPGTQAVVSALWAKGARACKVAYSSVPDSDIVDEQEGDDHDRSVV
jgi:hypothetical protein